MSTPTKKSKPTRSPSRSRSPAPRAEKRKERERERSSSPAPAPAAATTTKHAEKRKERARSPSPKKAKSKPKPAKKPAARRAAEDDDSSSSSSSGDSSSSSSSATVPFAKEASDDDHDAKSGASDEKAKKSKAAKRARSKERPATPPKETKKSKRAASEEGDAKKPKKAAKKERERSRPRDDSEEREAKPEPAKKASKDAKRSKKPAQASDTPAALKTNTAARSKAMALLPTFLGTAPNEIKDPVFDELYFFVRKVKGTLIPTYCVAKDARPSSNDEALHHSRIYEDVGEHILTSSPFGDVMAMLLGQPVAPRAVSVVRNFPAANPFKTWDGISYKPEDGKRRKIGYKTLLYLSPGAWTLSVPLPIEYYPVPSAEAGGKPTARSIELDAGANSVHVVAPSTTVRTSTPGAFAVFVVAPNTIADMPISTTIAPIAVQMDGTCDFSKPTKKDDKPKKPAEPEAEAEPEPAAAAAEPSDAKAKEPRADREAAPEADVASGGKAEPPKPEPPKAPVGTDTIENLAQVVADYFAEASIAMVNPVVALYTVPVGHEHADQAAFLKWAHGVLPHDADKPGGVEHRSKALTLKSGAVVTAGAMSGKTRNTEMELMPTIIAVLSAKTADGGSVYHLVFTNQRVEMDNAHGLLHSMRAADKDAKSWREKLHGAAKGASNDARVRMRLECITKSVEAHFK